MGFTKRALRSSGQTLSRMFLGKTDDFTSKGERHFNQRMLKHYLKGDKFFVFKGALAEVGQKYYAI